jgi:hypothetical protein
MLLEEIREKQETIIKTLASNAVTSMEQYRHLSGRLQGLEEGLCMVKDLYNSMVETRMLSREDVKE